jgi:hypothetical protein
MDIPKCTLEHTLDHSLTQIAYPPDILGLDFGQGPKRSKTTRSTYMVFTARCMDRDGYTCSPAMSLQDNGNRPTQWPWAAESPIRSIAAYGRIHHIHEDVMRRSKFLAARAAWPREHHEDVLQLDTETVPCSPSEFRLVIEFLYTQRIDWKASLPLSRWLHLGLYFGLDSMVLHSRLAYLQWTLVTLCGMALCFGQQCVACGWGATLRACIIFKHAWTNALQTRLETVVAVEVTAIVATLNKWNEEHFVLLLMACTITVAIRQRRMMEIWQVLGALISPRTFAGIGDAYLWNPMKIKQVLAVNDDLLLLWTGVVVGGIVWRYFALRYGGESRQISVIAAFWTVVSMRFYIAATATATE